MNNLKSYWLLDGHDNKFPTLLAAKYECYLRYESWEALAYLKDKEISHFIDGRCISKVSITVSSRGYLFFSRPQRV